MGGLQTCMEQYEQSRRAQNDIWRPTTYCHMAIWWKHRGQTSHPKRSLDTHNCLRNAVRGTSETNRLWEPPEKQVHKGNWQGSTTQHPEKLQKSHDKSFPTNRTQHQTTMARLHTHLRWNTKWPLQIRRYLGRDTQISSMWRENQSKKQSRKKTMVANAHRSH